MTFECIIDMMKLLTWIGLGFVMWRVGLIQGRSEWMSELRKYISRTKGGV
jgi:hypothetical protein